MRISDWSSDVCSSDLRMPRIGKKGGEGLRRLLPGFALSGRAALVGGGSARETLLQGGKDDGSRLALRERGVCHEICVEGVEPGALTGAAREDTDISSTPCLIGPGQRVSDGLGQTAKR